MASKTVKPLCLLALGVFPSKLILYARAHSNSLLDGGGIRGLAELCILREIMSRLKYKLKLDKSPIPAEYFDLIGGTSTGGYITISVTYSPLADQGC